MLCGDMLDKFFDFIYDFTEEMEWDFLYTRDKESGPYPGELLAFPFATSYRARGSDWMCDWLRQHGPPSRSGFHRLVVVTQEIAETRLAHLYTCNLECSSVTS